MLEQIEQYAKENNIPIMQKDGIEFLTDFIKNNSIKNILEIGTAIGYSAIKMCLVDKNITITTIERNIERYNIAIKNITAFGLENRINAICADALDIEITGNYDLIFIDAAKAQSIKFFEKYEVLLNRNGYIITDNLNFHGLVNTDKTLSRNLRQLVRKINNYIEFLKQNDRYNTDFYDIGDGISISRKR